MGGSIDEKIAEIKSTLSTESRQTAAVLRGPNGKLLPIVLVGIALAVLQQFVGINVIFYYSTMLWEAVGFTESDALLTGVITSVTNIATTILAIALIDKVGRKPLLLVGSIGMAATLGTMAFIFGTAPTIINEAGGAQPVLGDGVGIVAVVAANLYVVFFGMSWGPIMWVLLGEMFSNKIRAYAIAIAGAANWIANFIVSQTFPPMADMSLGLAYGIYTAMSLVSFVFVAKFIKETRGMELEEMV